MNPSLLSHKLLHLIALLRNERRSLDELIDRQTRKLGRLVRHAATHVPMYRELFGQAGLDPRDIRSLDDLRHLPVIDKTDFNARPPTHALDRRIVRPDRLLRITTSGSSGDTLTILVDRAYDQLRKALCLRPYLTNGLGLRDSMVTFTGHPRKTRPAHQRLGLLPDLQVDARLDAESHLALLRRVRPAAIRGYPSVLALICARISAHGEAGPAPRLVFTDSELLTPGVRRLLEKTCERPVIDVFGTFETDNIAYQCERRRGYHIALDAVIMEIVKNNRPAARGESGEIVCTVLDNYAMPFIRYNLHDLGFFDARPCDCGRTFPILNGICGRTSEYALRRNGTRVPATVLRSEIDRHAEFMRAYQIVQEDLGVFRIRVVPRGNGCTPPVEQRLVAAMRRLFDRPRVYVEIVAAISRERSGKFQAFKRALACDEGRARRSGEDRHDR